MLARICQDNPSAPAPALVSLFFDTYANFNWEASHVALRLKNGVECPFHRENRVRTDRYLSFRFSQCIVLLITVIILASVAVIDSDGCFSKERAGCVPGCVALQAA
jgi:hypothetical protein